jgi:hypothetical protein
MWLIDNGSKAMQFWPFLVRQVPVSWGGEAARHLIFLTSDKPLATFVWPVGDTRTHKEPRRPGTPDPGNYALLISFF